jgi:hypothetical protein
MNQAGYVSTISRINGPITRDTNILIPSWNQFCEKFPEFEKVSHRINVLVMNEEKKLKKNNAMIESQASIWMTLSVIAVNLVF